MAAQVRREGRGKSQTCRNWEPTNVPSSFSFAVIFQCRLEAGPGTPAIRDPEQKEMTKKIRASLMRMQVSAAQVVFTDETIDQVAVTACCAGRLAGWLPTLRPSCCCWLSSFEFHMTVDRTVTKTRGTVSHQRQLSWIRRSQREASRARSSWRLWKWPTGPKAIYESHLLMCHAAGAGSMARRACAV